MTHANSLCPECGHKPGKPQGPDWIERLFRLRRLPASCSEPDGGMNPSGWTGECGCTNAFHGS